MDNKNVFIAVALSMSVLLFWSAFVDPPKPIEKQNQKNVCLTRWPNKQKLQLKMKDFLKCT